MPASLELFESPTAEEVYMIAGWRQWADAGSISSTFPKYLVEEFKAEQIGFIDGDEFYMFQIPGTNDLVRPVVDINEGFPKSLEEPENDIYYAEVNGKGIVIFIGDEPQLHVKKYADLFFEAVEKLNVKRIILLGGVYGELPFDKERSISCLISQTQLRKELESYAVNFSNYKGGASIGTYMARQAVKHNTPLIGFYAFVPTFDFTQVSKAQNVRIENDFMAWDGVMRRLDHMLKLNFDFSDLEKKCKRLLTVLENKVAEIESAEPHVDIRGYLAKISAEFTEVPFVPLDDIWEQEVRNLFDDEE